MSVQTHVRLQLKPRCDWQVGAQVMLLRNLELTGNDRMLVNGSRGVITKFVSKAVSTPPLRCTDLPSGCFGKSCFGAHKTCIQSAESGCFSAHGIYGPSYCSYE